MRPGERYCPICRYWDGHEQDCPERPHEEAPGSPFDPEPSPYVSIHMARRQADQVRTIIQNAALGRARSHPLWAALKRIDAALEKNRGDAT